MACQNNQKDEKYTCPMHPEVQSDQPGNCSKCGMKLVEKTSKGNPKFYSLLVAFSLILFSCNDNASKNDESSDTTTTAKQGDTSSPTSPRATSASNELMSGMSSMMQDMKSMQHTGDPDHDFAMMMSRHHKGAIDMAAVQVDKGTDNALKRIARKIRDESETENKELQDFLASHKGNKKSNFAEKSMAMMENSMSNHSMTGNTDADFASMMIQHHRDGIEMAKEYLKTGTASTPKKIANKIISNQPKDIRELEDWRNSNK